MEKIVIVGAGLAAHRAAQTLRRDGFAGALVMVGDEPHPPYDRPPLSKQLLAGAIEPAQIFFTMDGLELDLQPGRSATGLDVERRVVTVDGGEEIGYDGLVIATGRRARPWPDLPALDGLHYLRSLDDSRRLKEEVRPGLRVAIVGAGFIGCEVAATLRGLGVEDVTLIEVAPYPMPALGPEVGQRALAIHERHGVRLRMGTTVEEFVGDGGRVAGVRLAGGEELAADVVLLGLGSLPNSEWLADSGLTLRNGTVECDERCFALGTDNVVAAGDIAAFPHPIAGEAISIEHWSNAREMGAVAAANLLRAPDEREVFATVPTFWSDQHDVKINSVGLPGLADSYAVVDEDPEKPALVVEAHRAGELVGVVGFNRARAIIGYQRQLAATLVA